MNLPALRVLSAVMLAAAVMVPVPVSAHIPHDDVAQVVASPTYSTDATVFVITRGGLLRSTNGGVSWSSGLDHRPGVRRLAIAASNAMVMYLARTDGVYRSVDQGLSWTPTAPVAGSAIADLAVSPGSERVVFAAGVSKGLFRTTNAGQTWDAVGAFGRITALAYSGAEDGRIFVGEASGAVFASEDNGATWSRASGTPGDDAITAIGASADASTVLAGTKSGRLFQSVDGAVSFTEVGLGLPGERVLSIALSTRYPSDATVWVSTWNDVYRSTDRGVSFLHSGEGLTTDPQADRYGVPQFRGVFAAAGKDGQHVFAAGFDGLFRSEDEGAHWREIQTATEQIVGLDVSPSYASDGTVMVTTYVKGAYVSKNAGATWHDSDVGLGIARSQYTNKYAPLYRMHNVVFSPTYADDGTVFSSTLCSLLKSTDRGESWTKIDIGPIPAPMARFIIAVSPAYATDRTVYAGTFQGNLWRSTQGGAANTWKLVADFRYRIRSLILSPNFAAAPVLYASTEQGIVMSMDAGVRWQRTGPPGESLLAISPAYAVDGTVFAVTESKLFVTRDSARSWTEIPMPTTARIEAIGVSPDYRNDGTVLVSVSGSGLFKSSDGGRSFGATGESLMQSHVLIGDYANPTSAPIRFSPSYAFDKTIFGFAGGNVVKSTDGGATWNVLELPPAESLLRAPEISVAPTLASTSEGTTGARNVVRVPFDLSHPYDSDVTVQWRTFDLDTPGFASSAAGDFQATSNTIVFPRGSTRQYASVVVTGDALAEPDEMILIALHDATNASIGGFHGFAGLGLGWVLNDDGGR